MTGLAAYVWAILNVVWHYVAYSQWLKYLSNALSFSVSVCVCFSFNLFWLALDILDLCLLVFDLSYLA